MRGKKLAACHRHWTAFLVQGFFAIVFIVGSFDSVIETGIDDSNIIMFVIGLILSAYIVISYKSDCLVLTETMVIGRAGFIKSKRMSTPISKIQNISVENGILGKIFRYHTVIIDNAGTGGSEYVFKNMAHAVEFVSAVQDKM